MLIGEIVLWPANDIQRFQVKPKEITQLFGIQRALMPGEKIDQPKAKCHAADFIEGECAIAENDANADEG